MSVLETLNKSSTWLNNIKTEWLVNGTLLKISINTEKFVPDNNDDSSSVFDTSNQYHLTNFYMHPLLSQAGETATVILAPMYGGIWTLCISLTGIITTYYS